MKSSLWLTIYGLMILLGICASGIAEPISKPVTPTRPNSVVALGCIQPDGEVSKLSVVNA